VFTPESQITVNRRDVLILGAFFKSLTDAVLQKQNVSAVWRGRYGRGITLRRD